MQSKLLLLLFPFVLGVRKCIPEKKFLRFYKIRTCYKSTLPVISWNNFDNIEDCKKYARNKNGLAFNFSPPELTDITQNRWFRNCQVLGCPETQNTTTLVFDPNFDYYTSYGDFSSTVNSTCIKSVGLFDLIMQKMDHTSAVTFCQNNGAELANVLSESRTNALSALLKSMKNWYKAAYVGLDDIEVEGEFETPMGNFLQCTKFRAWSVGHPRPNRKKEDCVILNADRTWIVINCKIKLPFICEFYSAAPVTTINDFSIKNCTKIKNRRKKKKCLADNELFHLYQNSSRIDQCAFFVND